MKLRVCTLLVTCAFVAGSAYKATGQQPSTGPSELSAAQRLDVMTSKLESMRRSLTSALDVMTPSDKNAKANADDPIVRLRGLQKEVSQTMSEVNDIRAKNDRAERYDASSLDRLEATVTELNTRVDSGLQATAGARTAAANGAASADGGKKKKKGKFLGIFGGGEDKYAELTGAAVAGRDRVLFEEAAKEVRKGHHDTGRLLFSTIINTYPDSAFLPLAKLAIADSFFLEGTTSSLIQAAQAYQDWLTFFPADPLADDAMLKVAEAEMRQMGLSNRDITHARKAEQRLKSLLQQYPQTKLRPVVEDRLREVQENLAMHNLSIARFYQDSRFGHGQGGNKGAQSRLKEIVEKYPCFSYGDEVLFRLGTTYQAEEEPDEAAKYYQQLLQTFPDSDFNEKAREQLNIIGSPIPEKATPKACVKKEEKSFMGNLMQEVSGRADVTIDKNGILITRNGKEGTDLIDEAIRYNGQLPPSATPVAPVLRGNPGTSSPAAAGNGANHGGPTSSTRSAVPNAVKP
jgi:outer membrane protein assembly factor BamD